MAYFLLSLIIILAFITFIQDVRTKYDQEVAKEVAKVEQCKKDYKTNRCDDPVPFVVEQCNKLTQCINSDPENSIKTFNVLARIVSEILNDLTTGMTYESLGLVAVIVMISMCCCGKCGVSRQNGKVNVTVGDSKESKKSYKSPE